MNSELYSVGSIIEVQRRRHKFKTNEYQASGSIPIIDQSTDFIAGFTNELDRAYEGELPVIIFGDHTCCLKFIDFRFAVGADGTQLLRPIKGIDARYLYYALHAADLEQFGYQRHFKLLKDCEVRVPPLETQRRIASILGAYDDLIEVNRRRIAVLEEMARGLFEEWFVHFRFPGHEAATILDTPDGPLPEGWISQTVGDTFDLLGGGTPSKAEPDYWTDGTIDWFTPSDLTKSKTLFMDRSGDRITPLGLARSSAKMFPAGSIMMTSRATIGEISICAGPACTNQGFITCLPNDVAPRSYLYFWLLQNVPLFIAHATGATFKEIAKGVFKRLPITVPPHVISAHFDEQVRPMHDMILAFERSNRALAASRDLLLPRLISGQLSVAQAERELEEAA